MPGVVGRLHPVLLDRDQRLRDAGDPRRSGDPGAGDRDLRLHDAAARLVDRGGAGGRPGRELARAALSRLAPRRAPGVVVRARATRRAAAAWIAAARRRRRDLPLHARADPDHGRGLVQRIEPLALPAAGLFAALVGRARYRWEWIDPLLFSLKLGLAVAAPRRDPAGAAAGFRAGAPPLPRARRAARADARAAAAAGAGHRRRPAAALPVCRPARPASGCRR